jgi:hypothetical protein
MNKTQSKELILVLQNNSKLPHFLPLIFDFTENKQNVFYTTTTTGLVLRKF